MIAKESCLWTPTSCCRNKKMDKKMLFGYQRLSLCLFGFVSWSWISNENIFISISTRLYVSCSSFVLLPLFCVEKYARGYCHMWPLLLTWLNPNIDKWSHAQKSVGWNYLSIPKLQWLHHWSLGMDKYFHPHFMMDVITYACWDLSQTMLAKGASDLQLHVKTSFNMALHQFALLWNLHHAIILSLSSSFL